MVSYLRGWLSVFATRSDSLSEFQMDFLIKE